MPVERRRIGDRAGRCRPRPTKPNETATTANGWVRRHSSVGAWPTDDTRSPAPAAARRSGGCPRAGPPRPPRRAAPSRATPVTAAGGVARGSSQTAAQCGCSPLQSRERTPRGYRPKGRSLLGRFGRGRSGLSARCGDHCPAATVDHVTSPSPAWAASPPADPGSSSVPGSSIALLRRRILHRLRPGAGGPVRGAGARLARRRRAPGARERRRRWGSAPTSCVTPDPTSPERSTPPRSRPTWPASRTRSPRSPTSSAPPSTTEGEVALVRVQYPEPARLGPAGPGRTSSRPSTTCARRPSCGSRPAATCTSRSRRRRPVSARRSACWSRSSSCSWRSAPWSRWGCRSGPPWSGLAVGTGLLPLVAYAVDIPSGRS